MKEETKKYPEEFKTQIVELYVNGKSVINLAREYGLKQFTKFSNHNIENNSCCLL